jgi:putative ABC transport system permease protein
MKQSIYLAFRYLTFHRVRTTILVAAIGLIIFLPVGLQRLITDSEKQMMARAETFPLIVGVKGSSTDLVINAIYFQQQEMEQLTMKTGQVLKETNLGYPIPVLSMFNARNFPIVGTNLDYFEFRNLHINEGRALQYVGECVIGANVAARLGLHPGDSLISSPENYFDMAGVYPLKMEVVGVLSPSSSPDDDVIFTDLKTNWIIMGLGHGHEDVVKLTDPTLVMQRDSANVSATAKLFIYNEIDGENMDSFHFHGTMDEYPVSAFIFIPDDIKSSTILRGRFKTGELANQVVVPATVVEHLLQTIFRIKYIFNTVFLLVGLATLLILVLIVMLSIRLRKDEIHTMFTMGSSRYKTIEIMGIELVILVILSAIIAAAFYFVTGFFVDDFIKYFIL